MDNSLFRHFEIDNKTSKVLFLYHGTGGMETDLLPLVKPFQKSHTIVGLRGNVVENGMPRFFKRLDFGIFDQENIKEEVGKLVMFINDWAKEHTVKTENILHVGYSNGANFILAAMFYHPEIIKKAALLHPMLPFEPDKKLDLSKQELFVSWGQYDQMIKPEQSKQVVEILNTHAAKITEITTEEGHGITESEISQLHSFINI